MRGRGDSDSQTRVENTLLVIGEAVEVIGAKAPTEEPFHQGHFYSFKLVFRFVLNHPVSAAQPHSCLAKVRPCVRYAEATPCRSTVLCGSVTL